MFSTSSTASSSVTEAPRRMFMPTWTWTKPSWPQPELSIGRELEALDSAHRCWDIKGPVLELATRIYAAVQKELDLRADYLVQRERIRKPVLFRMYMTGRRQEEANPTLLFSCSREQPRKRAKEVVKESGILRDHPTVRLAHRKRLPQAPTPFRILVGPMNKIATGGSELFGEVYCISPVDRTCGVPVFMRRRDGSFRKATIGGIVQLGGTYYGLTVAHTFVDDGSESGADSDDDSSDMECSFDSEDEISSEEPREPAARFEGGRHPRRESGSHGPREFSSFRTATLSRALQHIDGELCCCSQKFQLTIDMQRTKQAPALSEIFTSTQRTRGWIGHSLKLTTVGLIPKRAMQSLSVTNMRRGLCGPEHWSPQEPRRDKC